MSEEEKKPDTGLQGGEQQNGTERMRLWMYSIDVGYGTRIKITQRPF